MITRFQLSYRNVKGVKQRDEARVNFASLSQSIDFKQSTVYYYLVIVVNDRGDIVIL